MSKTIRNFFYLIICSLMIWLGFYFNSPANDTTINEQQALHTVSRLSFGITPQQIDTVKDRGLENYIQAQLNPASITQSTLDKQLASLETTAQKSSDLFAVYQQYSNQLKDQNAKALSVKEKQVIQQKRNQYRNNVARQARHAHLAIAIASERQLQEVMTDFWLNHFNVYGSKKIVPFWLADYENDLRELALGNFHDLLSLTAHHPAMLVYLDNSLNSVPDDSPKKGNANGINENYARELMELHTLGVDGGYTQQDVTALARILTGWGVDRTGKLGDENSFRFYQQRHDFSDKVFLGEKIAGSGIAEGERALDLLAHHPETAHFISYKLAQYFVADTPPETLVETLSQTFLDSQGNLKTVLDTLFHSPEFNDSQYYRVKFKTPFQYVVSIVRASGIDDPDLKKMEGILTRLSMPVFGSEAPKGYQNTESAWLNPNGMLNRLGFTISIANGLLSDGKPIDATALQKTLEKSLTVETQNAIADSPESLKAALILGSPEMMYR